VAGPQQAEEVVQGGADVAHVDLDVRQRRRAQRQDDVAGARRVGYALRPIDGPARADPREHFGGAGLLERHAGRLDGGEALGVLLHAEDPQAPVGEGEGQRQPDAAAPDDRDVELRVHGARRAYGVRRRARRRPTHCRVKPVTKRGL
jgi:hypothetical protein